MSTSASSGKRGQPSRYLNGGTNALMGGPNKPGNEQNDGWTRKQLMEMDSDFIAAMERAIARGLEQPERNGYLTRRAPPAPACDAAPAGIGCCTSPRQLASG